MLDVLAELIIDLIQGKDRKKGQNPAPRKTPPPTRHPYSTGGSDASAAPSGGQGMTIDEVMRHMQEQAARGGAGAPVLDPQFHPGQSGRSSRRPAARQSYAAQRRPSAPAPSPSPDPSPAPRVEAVRTYSPSPVQVMRQAASPAPEENARPLATGSDFAARLRGNPNAAREAFVFSEIFGRPLGEKM